MRAQLQHWREWRWGFWLSFAFFVAIILTALIGGWQLYQALLDERQAPLDQLSVQGELRYVQPEQVRAALNRGTIGSFFSADVNALRQRVEQLPWVATASLRKVWPDRLSVYVVEQQPVAHWNHDRLLNEQGQVFKAAVTKDHALPSLYGPEDAVAETLQRYRELQSLLSINGFAIDALRLSPRFAVNIVLTNGIELRLGREAAGERVKRFIDVYETIKKQSDKAIDYVDCRYDTGVAVSWRDKEE
ncbi:cell division protein DivIVA [Idiomarina tyrosinivorans]|uniref:Cell division protein FtsQ n=1 Tax=Idiomarina tyrosinivorans TaxID=1445662 RepID=A0A432ZQA6_9GAMM|nr:cell division protein FtsQ/DivIB [Idiomarina tyrosinivorans]RUO80077.1 cell division protein DivIVA [Idiomarina tyrosinivorans]